ISLLLEQPANRDNASKPDKVWYFMSGVSSLQLKLIHLELWCSAKRFVTFLAVTDTMTPYFSTLVAISLTVFKKVRYGSAD
ncbi:hypothetical protein, partial [Vibrio fluvialis]|uniref:hypothetical protein n=1 Tax=Vibrio fluvialis TaxID=676 RepID=UPI001EEC6ED0